MKRIFSFAALCIFFTFNIYAQENPLLRQLLDLPAPPPVSKDETDNGINKTPARPDEFYKKENVPPDDAPIEDLLDFWKRQNFYEASHPDKIKPGEKTLQRLIESFEDQPENLKDFLKLIPATEEVAAKVKNIFDANNRNFDEIWRESVQRWLKYNSKFFSDELFAEAQKARDHKTYKSVANEPELRTLAKVDWERAEPLLQRLENDTNNPRTAFAAKRLFYERAIKTNDSATAERYRDEFRKIVENKNASGTERDDAFDALMLNKDWSGQDEWYVSLFQDQTLLELSLGESTITHPLDSLVSRNPDKWIPIVSKLVNNNNRAIHNAAVQALSQFNDKDARKDALEPLLPWISNPDWAKVETDGRLDLIQSMDLIDMPESVPALLWAVENDEESSTRAYAAESLAKYKDSRIVQALKNALQKEPTENDRRRIISALLAGNGLTDDEQIVYLESYVRAISTPEGYKKIEDRSAYEEENPLPVSVSIGKYLSELSEPGEGLIVRALERHKILEKENPQIAKILAGIMAKWRGRIIDLEILRKISAGEADLGTIINALARRMELKKSVPNDLYAMRGKIGLPGAVAACILEDENDILAAFGSQNWEMKIGTLACARLLRKPLPVNTVGFIFLINPTDSLSELAAERYLEAEDSPEARRFVLLKHPNKALILGARESSNPAKQKISGDVPLNDLFMSVGRYLTGESYVELEKFEAKLQKELIENPELIEIYALLPDWESFQKVIRVYKNKVVLTLYDDPARYRERFLSGKEIEFLQNTIKRSPIENSPPIYSSCHHECGTSEYLRLDRSGGRRVYSRTGFETPEPLETISTMFRNFADAGEFKIHYNLSDKIKGLELLFADKNFQPKAIWKNGDDFRVLVFDEERKEQIDEEIDGQNKIDSDNEDLNYDIRSKNARQRRIDREFEPYEWRDFKDGKLGGKVEEPSEVPFLRDKQTFPVVQDLEENTSGWQSRSGFFEIRVGDYSKSGLWKTNRSQQIELKKGNYSNPFVSGNYVVAAKTDSDWSVPNYVVRIDLQTGKETKINLPPADFFEPDAIVPAQNKVLLYRDTEPASKNPAEHYLLDAATGKIEPVKGEFIPLRQQTFRSLQPTENPNEFWAAVYDDKKNQTVIGRYDAKNFAIKPVLTVPEIRLDSMQIWVDEKAGKVYFIYQANFSGESHLLSLPLSAEKQ